MLRAFYTRLPDSFPEELPYPMSEYRSAKLAKVTAPQLRRQMIAAEWLLIHAVRDVCPDVQLPLHIETCENGKPFLRDLPLYFSLSHSGDFVACALADYEIGLDIQKKSALHAPLANRLFTEEERAFIQNSADADIAFTQLWCLKESYIKATGEGISRALSELSLNFSQPFSVKGDPNARFWQYGEPAFQAAICALEGKDPQPETWMEIELRL